MQRSISNGVLRAPVKDSLARFRRLFAAVLFALCLPSAAFAGFDLTFEGWTFASDGTYAARFSAAPASLYCPGECDIFPVVTGGSYARRSHSGTEVIIYIRRDGAAQSTVTLPANYVAKTSGGEYSNQITSPQLTLPPDTTPPVATITTQPSGTIGLTNPSTSSGFRIDYSFSEYFADLTASDFALTNATIKSAEKLGNRSYRVWFLPIADGPVVVTLPAAKIVDPAGNTATAAAVVSVTADGTPPTISIAPFTGAANGAQTAQITLSEDVTDFTLSDLSVTNATATLSGSVRNYTAVLTPLVDGPVTLSVAAGTVSDATGNINAASNTVSMTYDGTAPSISIAAFTGPANGAQSAIITLSEPASNFTLSDLSLTNATATLSGSGASYTVVLTPLTDGDVALSVTAGRFTDAAGNANTASNEVSRSVDITAPDVSLTAAQAIIPAGGSFDVTITFTEAVTGVAAGDLMVTNGVATALSGSGTTYVATIQADNGGDIAVRLPANAAQDAVGNGNTASNELTRDYDGVFPAISIAAFTGPLNGAQTAIITLSEPSTTFTLADLSVTNATATLTGSDSSYTAVLTPTADGPVTLSVAAGTFTDAAGNPNTASNTVSMTYDGTAPSISIAAFTGPANGVQSAVITLSEPASDFTLSDLSLTNATATLSGSGASYTAVLTPLADGDVVLSVAAGRFTDAAGNANTASNTVTMTYDGTAPAVTLSTPATSTAGASTFPVTVQFSEPVTGFEITDLLVANGTATALSGSGSDYNVTVQASGAGDTSVSVPVAAAQDAAGNGNLQSNTLSVTSATIDVTQEKIAQFMLARSRQLLGSQPDLTGFLSGTQAGGFSASASRGLSQFSYASAPGRPVWMVLTGSWSEQDDAKTTYVFGAVGSHLTLTPNLLLGAMVEFDHAAMREDSTRIHGTGWLAGPYFVARLPEAPIYFEGRVLFGQSSNRITPFGTYTDRFNTTRTLGLFKVSGEVQSGALTLSPNLSYAYTEDRQKRYVDGLGNEIPAQKLALAETALGLDLSYRADWVPAQDALTLTGGIKLIHSSTSGAGYGVDALPAGSATRGRVNLGLDYQIGVDSTWTATLAYDGIGMADYEAIAAQIGFQTRF
ncbi:MAG: Ig-like domain-containing protein [Paracoccaceae bacterium]|nr:Ig-like domain-containing protein [Paracoccaceae bacterium]